MRGGCVRMWLLFQHHVQPRHVSNLQNPVCAFSRSNAKAEKNDACSFFLRCYTQTSRWNGNSFSHLMTTWGWKKSNSFAFLVSTLDENQNLFLLVFFRLSLWIFQELLFFSRRFSLEQIRRFKGCEYVYANVRSLKIYINFRIVNVAKSGL